MDAIDYSDSENWALVIDNNLLNVTTRIGNSELELRFFKSIFSNKHFPSGQNWLINPSSILEFLGIVVRSIPFDFKWYELEMEKCFDNGVPDHKKISKTLGKMVKAYESELKNTHIFSKKNLNAKLAEKLSYIDEKVKEKVGSAFADCIDKDGRDLMYNVISIERIQDYVWPSKFRSPIYSTYLRETHYSADKRLNLNFVRLNKRLTQDLFDNHEIQSSDGVVEESVQSLVEANLERLKKATGFKRDGDFLDTSAINQVCVGHYFNERDIKICFATQDSFEDLILRIAFFKSIVRHAMKFPKSGNFRNELKLNEGIVLGYSSEVELIYKIDVSKVPLIDDSFYFKDIQNWLEIQRKICTA